MREPRGHKDMFGVFLTPPSSPEYDAGLIYIDGTEYSHMCGHGTIAVSMAMVANGLVPRGKDGITRIRFETTAGLVVSEVASEGDNVLWTRFENVPAYVAAQDIPVELPGYGKLSADIVWGGNYFGIVDCRTATCAFRRTTARNCRAWACWCATSSMHATASSTPPKRTSTT